MEQVKEAIAHYSYGIAHDIFKPPVTVYANLAIAALEKMDAKLVKHNKTFWSYKHFCPKCSTILLRENIKYCDNCGQKLDWSNYWEALK